MNGLSLRKKLLLGFSVLIGILVISSLYSVRSFRAMEASSSELIKILIPSIGNCNVMVDNINVYKTDLYRHVLSTQMDQMDKYEGELKKTDESIKEAIKAYLDLVKVAPYENEADRQKDGEQIKNIEVTWNQIYSRTPEIVALSRAQKIKEALAVLQSIMPQLESLENDEVRPILAFNEKVAADFLVKSESLYSSTIWFSNIIIVVGVIAGIVIAMVITRNIMNPVQELMRVFELVAGGDLREHGVIRANDELGLLIRNYNDLLVNVGDLIRQIQNTAEQVASSSEELTATAEQSAQVTDQIVGSIQQVSNLSKKEVESVNDASKAIEQISAGVEESASTVVMTTEHAQKALHTAKEGQEIIRGAVIQMENIERTVNRSADVVTKLGDRSKEIGQIVDTISGIAGQTNLLALNAAIEAARAGEQGKGFAVVAEEVRKLAEQSQEAAKQIGGLISGIQVDTEQAVVAMGEGTTEVRAGTDVVNKAGIAFGELLKMIDEVNHQTDDMAKTTEELAMGIQNVVDSIQSIDNASHEVSNESGQVSSATEEQSAAMQQIASSSRSLSDLAQSLQTVAMRFKV